MKKNFKDAWRLNLTFGLVISDATLADAKLVMDASRGVANYQDIFVTQTGSREEPVLGWITNDIVLKNSEVITARRARTSLADRKLLCRPSANCTEP